MRFGISDLNEKTTMKTRCRKIHDTLFDNYGTIDCPLNYETEFQLMVAVILSAQCTDKQVNKVTAKLFAQYPTPELLSKASATDIETIIRPLGLYRNKAKNILETSKRLVKKYDAKIPKDIETLITLPGIGRKTANAVVAHAFNKPGFAVDTHVIRLLNRIGVVDTENPVKIEFKVRKLIPLKFLGNFSLLLITHGRQCCKARKPDCCNCAINTLCKSNQC